MFGGLLLCFWCGGPPVASWAISRSPHLAAIHAYDYDEMFGSPFGRLDPWGRSYACCPANQGSSPLLVYSKGPNGRDEAGLGDDIVVAPVNPEYSFLLSVMVAVPKVLIVVLLSAWFWQARPPKEGSTV